MTTQKQKDKLIEAAQQAFTFTVEGPGNVTFPFDMLRYDLCWPKSETDSGMLTSDWPRTIELRGLKEPTVRRWASFGWTVKSLV
jgi:hypothetical protein